MHFAKTRPLILESLSQGNQKPTRDWREVKGPGLEGQSRSFGWPHYVLYSTGSCQNSEHTPNWLKYNKHIPGQVKMTFGLSAQCGYLCHLSPFLAWTTEIYMLSGGVYRWVSVGAGESWWEGQWTRDPDEVLVLVSSLNLSGDSGKSLHPWLLPHPGGANTSELNSLSQGYRYCLRKHGKCKACQVNIQVRSQHPWVNLWGNSFHIKSMLYFSWVKINSRRGWYQWPQKTNSNLTLIYRKIPQDGKTPRHAHFFHVQFDLAPMNTQRTQKVHCTLITFLGI